MSGPAAPSQEGRAAAKRTLRGPGAAWTFALLLLVAGATGAWTEALLEAAPGWDRFFGLTWEAAEWRGQPTVAGRIVNRYGHTAVDVRLLIEGLDAQGRVARQTVARLPGELGGFSSTAFEVVQPSRFRAYRVRVFSFDWLSADP